MNIRTPYYYPEFRCIADKCTDTCCAGWDVDVDKKSTEYYKSVPGVFGERIASVMVEHEDGESHFTLKSNGWCPFLNEHLLCDLYTELGEDKLCDTCANFPRFIEEYGGTREIGLAFSCITAGELMLKDDTPVTFLNNDDGKQITGYNNIDPDLYFYLQRYRKQSYDITRDRGRDICSRYALVLSMASKLNEQIKKKDYRDISVKGYSKKKSNRFELMKDYIGIFGKLEVINHNWNTLIEQVRALHKDMEEEKYYELCAEFEEYYLDRQYEYEHLLMYYLYRYFLKAVNDNDVLSKVKFAVTGFIMIREFDVARWYANGGTLTKDEQVDIYHLYSREVEHSYENYELLSNKMASDKLFSTDNLLSVI